MSFRLLGFALAAAAALGVMLAGARAADPQIERGKYLASFGGMKSPGIGRDGGDYSFDFYMETKHVSLARGTHKIQKLGLPSS